MKTNLAIISALTLLLSSFAPAGAAGLEVMAKSPYSGAIVIDAATGNVLFEDNADAKAYPASITKLMVLLVILDAVEARRLTLDEPVTVTAQASTIGGSQVYLKEGEVFPVDELLYALIVQSANDAATALAIHYGRQQGGVRGADEQARPGTRDERHVFSLRAGPASGKRSAAGCVHPARHREAVS